MRDPKLSLISAILLVPKKRQKFYLDTSKLSRGTFFKVKAELSEQGIVTIDEAKQMKLDHEKALKFVNENYPGLACTFDTTLGCSVNTYGDHRSANTGETDKQE